MGNARRGRIIKSGMDDVGKGPERKKSGKGNVWGYKVEEGSCLRGILSGGGYGEMIRELIKGGNRREDDVKRE